MTTVIDNGSATPGDAQPFVTLRLVGAIAENVEANGGIDEADVEGKDRLACG